MAEKGSGKPQQPKGPTLSEAPHEKNGKQKLAGLSSRTGNVPETCAYISAMATELQQIANETNLPVIAYFLDMVRMEAESIISLSRAGD